MQITFLFNLYSTIRTTTPTQMELKSSNAYCIVCLQIMLHQHSTSANIRRNVFYSHRNLFLRSVSRRNSILFPSSKLACHGYANTRIFIYLVKCSHFNTWSFIIMFIIIIFVGNLKTTEQLSF